MLPPAVDTPTAASTGEAKDTKNSAPARTRIAGRRTEECRSASGVESCMDMLRLESALLLFLVCGSNMATTQFPGELLQV